MSLLKSRYIAAIMGLMISSTNLFSQDDFDSENLLYCNENIDIKYIWPLSENYFIANARYQTNSGGYTSNLFLLFNKEHLIIDSLYTNGGFLNSLVALDNNSFLLATTMTTQIYAIVNDQFVLNSSQNNKGGMESFLSNDFTKYSLGKFYGLEVGYETKAKDRTKKRSKKNIPRYYYLGDDGEKQWINSGKEKVVGDQWQSFVDKPLFDLGEVTSYNGEIYFNIPMIGICYILEPKTRKVRTVLYPTEGANSWFMTIDKVTGTTYLVGDMGDDQFSIYHIDLKTNKKVLVSTQQGFYDAIVNGQILVKKEVVLDRGGEFNCFYLVPTFNE